MYQLDKSVSRAVVSLKLIGDVSFKEFIEINAALMEAMDEMKGEVVLLIDLGQAKNVPFPTAHLKSSQTYAQHPMLNSIIIVTDNKLFRLMMALMFNPTQAKIEFFDTAGKAYGYLQTIRLN